MVAALARRRRASKPKEVSKATLSPTGTAQVDPALLVAITQNDDDGDIDCIIGFGLPAPVVQALAVTKAPPGVDVVPAEQLHVTLAHIELDASDPDVVQDALGLIASAAKVAYWMSPFDCDITGPSIFFPDPANDPDGTYHNVALVDSPSLPTLLSVVRDALDCACIPYSMNHGFLPHITLAHAPDYASAAKVIATMPQSKQPWIVDSLAVAIGEYVQHFILGTTDWDPSTPSYEQLAMAAEVIDEQRYTLTPLYMPMRNDTHGDAIGHRELEEAQWEYFREADHTINLQHLPQIKAGECVGIITWPWEVECEFRKGDGTRTTVKVPAGSVWQGIQWEPWAYEAIKRGDLNGISLEGWGLPVA